MIKVNVSKAWQDFFGCEYCVVLGAGGVFRCVASKKRKPNLVRERGVKSRSKQLVK